MALHHPATHVANDHFLQTGFLFIAITTAYVDWRWLYWLSTPRPAADWISGFTAIALPFTVAIAFVEALRRGAQTHLADERARVHRGLAEAIKTRAGGEEGAAEEINTERLKKISERFNRIQRRSKVVTLLIPAFFALVLKKFFH
jgi:hypothetical protein